MHRIKSIYLSLYLTAIMASLVTAIWQLSTAPESTAWWGVVVAAAAPVMFFSVLMIFRPTARTGDGLWWFPGAGVLGTAIAVTLGGVGLPAIIAAVVGIPMALLYTRWYSRFNARDTQHLAPGRNLPALTLHDTRGQTLTTAELVEKPALWMFYRGNWCPLCVAQIGEVAAQYRQLAERGVAVHLVSPQPQDHSPKLSQRFDAPMRFLVDRNNDAARALGILAEGGLPMGMQALGYDSDVPMPTVFITAAGGRVVYSDLTHNYRVRPEPAEFMAALDRAGI